VPLKRSEDDIHREASAELEYAMLHLTPADVLKCLKRLDRLDGEPFKILVGQLDGSIPRKTFRIRFQLKQAPGRPPSLGAEPDMRAGIPSFFNRLRKRGLNRKTAISRVCEDYELGKTAVEKILAEAKSVESE
jgi:hypothetical protein